MADAQPAGRPCCCLTFLNEALLLPARNRSVFLPTFTLSVAYTGFVDHAYTLALAGVLRPNAMAATYLLAALAGPAIRAITSAAAVAAYTERQTSFCALVLEELRGGLFKASTAATAADANVLWLAHRVIGGAALRVVTTQLFVRFLLTPLLMDLLVALHLVHRLLGNYLAAVSALAVVVSSSSKPAACQGTAALRRAWRITRCNAAWSAVLVAAQGFLAGVVPQWCEDAARCALEHSTISDDVVFERIVWTVHVLLRGGAAVLGVCAATAFYYRCTQGVGANGTATTGSENENENEEVEIATEETGADLNTLPCANTFQDQENENENEEVEIATEETGADLNTLSCANTFQDQGKPRYAACWIL